MHPPRGAEARDIFIPDVHIHTLKQKGRDFRWAVVNYHHSRLRSLHSALVQLG